MQMLLRTHCSHMEFLCLRLPPGASDSYSNDSALFNPPPPPTPTVQRTTSCSGDQVDPSVGHKGLTVKMQYSFISGFARGGSFLFRHEGVKWQLNATAFCVCHCSVSAQFCGISCRRIRDSMFEYGDVKLVLGHTARVYNVITELGR